MGRKVLVEVLVDIAWSLFWSSVILATLMYSGGTSNFIYIDF